MYECPCIRSRMYVCVCVCARAVSWIFVFTLQVQSFFLDVCIVSGSSDVSPVGGIGKVISQYEAADVLWMSDHGYFGCLITATAASLIIGIASVVEFRTDRTTRARALSLFSLSRSAFYYVLYVLCIVCICMYTYIHMDMYVCVCVCVRAGGTWR